MIANVSLRRLPWLVGAWLLLAPAAAAEGNATTTGRDYYLLRDADGRLGLSAMPPSAANETTWTVRLETVDGRAEKRVRLEFPPPDLQLDEDAGVLGGVRARAERVSDDGVPGVMFESYAARIQVWLVEGDRSVRLGEKRLASTPSDLDFEGDYPGHGTNAGPHTHGAGNDAARGLHLSDVRLDLVLLLQKQGPSMSEAVFDVSVFIDGRSFAHVEAAAAGPASTPAPTTSANGTATTPAPTNGTAEPPGNDTCPKNSTATKPPAHEGSKPGASATAQAGAAVGAAATVGVGLYTLRRPRRPA